MIISSAAAYRISFVSFPSSSSNNSIFNIIVALDIHIIMLRLHVAVLMMI